MGRAWLERRVSRHDMIRLQRQGFVNQQRLPSGNDCFKLRFRNENGRQRVVYIGTDLGLAEAIRNELMVLQTERRIQREAREAVKKANRALAASVKTLAPLLARRGLVFHGRAIRRRRQHNANHVLSTEDQRNV